MALTIVGTVAVTKETIVSTPRNTVSDAKVLTAISSDAAAPERYDRGPNFPLAEGGFDILPFNFVIVGGATVSGTCIESDAVDDELTLPLG
jgi:hypothetical protein